MKYLIFSVGEIKCALQADRVKEILRPPPYLNIRGNSPLIPGVIKIRGLTTPLVDLSFLLTGIANPQPKRVISRKNNSLEGVGLLVDRVYGLRSLSESIQLSPLVKNLLPHWLEGTITEPGEITFLVGGALKIPSENWEEWLEKGEGTL